MKPSLVWKVCTVIWIANSIVGALSKNIVACYNALCCIFFCWVISKLYEEFIDNEQIVEVKK